MFMNNDGLMMTTKGTVTKADGSYTLQIHTWRAIELCAGVWAIVNENGDRYGADAGRLTGFESRYWAEQAMKRIARRWGYRLELTS